MSSDLSRTEFLEHIGYLREDIKAVQTRLDGLNGRTRTAEQNIAVLKDRTSQTRRQGGAWGAGAGAAVGGALTVIWHWLSGLK